jgi:hypothetical protein
MLNPLANHGYLPRDGRSVNASDITKALHDVVVGVSTFVNAVFTHPITFTHKPTPQLNSFWSTIWHFLRHPSRKLSSPDLACAARIKLTPSAKSAVSTFTSSQTSAQ